MRHSTSRHLVKRSCADKRKRLRDSPERKSVFMGAVTLHRRRRRFSVVARGLRAYLHPTIKSRNWYYAASIWALQRRCIPTFYQILTIFFLNLFYSNFFYLSLYQRYFLADEVAQILII